MYASATYGHRTPGRSRHRKAQSDSGHPFVTPPYTVQWPAPARRTTEPTGMNAGIPYQQSPSRSSSVERIGNPFVPHLAPYSRSGTAPPTPVSPRSPSPQRSGHQRSSSRQGSIRAPQTSGPLIKDVPQPPRSALNIPSAVTASHPYPATWEQGQGASGQSQSPPTPTLFQSAGMQRQGSHHSHTVHQPSPASVYQSQSTSAAHSLHRHHSGFHHPRPTTTHHVVHPRPHSRRPSAGSHRYASSITQPVYGYGSSATPNASRTSLNGGAPSQRNHHATSPPLGTSAASYYYPGTGQTHMRSGSPQRSRSRTRDPSPSTPGTTPIPQSAHELKKISPSPPKRPLAAKEIRRNVHRPALPANYDGRETRYVNMLLALDDISTLFNILAAFFAWILLAGFVLLPSTFASWKNQPTGTAEGFLANVINNLSLYVVAFLCTGIGAGGMIWLWWRWRENYIWVTNRIFFPGCLNSVAGLISILSSIYGAQRGTLGRTEKSAIIVTSTLSLICGTLALVYEYWFIRNLRLEHDQEVEAEMAEEKGEGTLGEKKDERNGGA